MRMQVDFIIAFLKVVQVPATIAEFYEHNDVFHKPLVIYIYPFLGIELGEMKVSSHEREDDLAGGAWTYICEV